jgi:hypothetical protein
LDLAPGGFHAPADGEGERCPLVLPIGCYQEHLTPAGSKRRGRKEIAAPAFDMELLCREQGDLSKSVCTQTN